MKKRVPKKREAGEKRDQYTVVLENIHDQFRVFGDGLLGVHEKLDSHTEMIGQIMTDITDIKNELKEKIARDEFAKLEKRVIILERRRALGR